MPADTVNERVTPAIEALLLDDMLGKLAV